MVELLPKTGISDIKDYNSLSAAYSRLKNEGDGTVSASNAKTVFGQDVDGDGDNTAELWEFMQKANETQNKILFSEIEPLKKVQNNKYPNISDDNPINIILSIENEITGDEKTDNAYKIVNDIIGAAKAKITDNMTPEEKLNALYSIIKDDFKIQYHEFILLSDALAGDKRYADCDTSSFIYLAVAHEMKWPLYFAPLPGHAIVIWKTGMYTYIPFETTGEGSGMYGSLGVQGMESIIEKGDNKLFSEIYKNRAFVYSDSHKRKQAFSDWGKAIDLAPDKPSSRKWRGENHLKLHYNKLAIIDFNEYLKSDPNDLYCYQLRAEAYVNSRQHLLAIGDYTKIIELIPNTPQTTLNDNRVLFRAYWFRSWEYSALGNKDLAAKDKEIADKLSEKINNRQ